MAAQVEMVTVLFTDLVGSTALASRVGPERAEELRVEHFGLLREAIVNAGGHEVKNIGDGVMVVFPSAAASVQCAQAMQQRHEVRNRGADEKLLVRIGISMGDATREDGDYFGPPVVEAARLCAKAAGGQVLLAELTRLMVGRRGEHTFHPMGELQLKGLPEPVAACELVWEPLTAATTPLPPRLRAMPATAYVGREQVRDRLAQVWEKAAGGARRVVMVAGEPGIGKTRLATYLALKAHGEGARVLYGHCDEDMGASYQPWVQALGGLIEHCASGVLSAHVDRQGGELARLVPELARRVPDVPAPRLSDPETERYLLFAAIVDLLARATAAEPMVVLLDDLHWADKPTLLLLRHVAANATDSRLLLVGTYRDTDTAAGHPLTSLLADLRREQGMEWVQLSGLAQPEVEELIAAAAGHELDADGIRLAQALRRESDGNPFFMAEILRHLLESGGIVQRDDGRYTVSADITDLGIPRSVRDVIGQRVHRLGEDAMEALSAAAVIGREFDIDVLSAATGHTEDELLVSLEAAIAGSVLRENPQSPGAFVFAHALINHTLYENLSRTRRARLHARIAAAIEQLAGDDVDNRLGELAHHWAAATRSIDPTKAVAYARRAGERALAQLAPDEALRWFRKALEQLASHPGRDAERCDLLILTGEAQRQAGEPAYRETLFNAGTIANRLADPDRIARATLANTRWWGSNAGVIDAQRVSTLQEALAAGPSEIQRLRLMAQLASEVYLNWDFDRDVRPLIDQAIEGARKTADTRVLAEVLALISATISGRPDLLGERRELGAELYELTQALDDPHLQCLCALWQFINAMEIADTAGAAGCWQRIDELADRTGQPWMKWVSLVFATVRAQLAGDLTSTETLAADAVKVGIACGQTDALTYSGAQICTLRYEQGRLNEIIEGHLAAGDIVPGISAMRATPTFYLAELGRLDEAAPRLTAAAHDGFAVLPKDAFYLYSLAHYAQVAVRLGDIPTAATIYDLVLPYRALLIHDIAVVYGSAELILGELATALGRYDDAEQHFAAAAGLHERIGARLILARTRLRHADMLLRRQTRADYERAQELLVVVLADAQQLGATTIEQQARNLQSATVGKHLLP